MTLKNLIKEINSMKNKEKAIIYQRFFKTKRGEYGEGDMFIGITVPKQKKLAKEYLDLSLREIEYLLSHKIHEYRMIGIMLLVEKFKISDEKQQKEIFNLYLKYAKLNRINNWDLVDCSADKIIGNFLFEKNKDIKILKKLANSKNLWERRISIISTFYFIKKGKHKECFEISRILLKDNHDLIHKAVGWMLREVGKRISQEIEESFLKENNNHKKMPRTMLRYSIERFTPEKRKYYMGR